MYLWWLLWGSLERIIKYANLSYVVVSFFNLRVQQEIETWPVGVYADFLRLIELLQDHGVDLRMPHSRALGKGLFELRCKGSEGIGRAFYCTLVGKEIVILYSFIKNLRKHHLPI